MRQLLLFISLFLFSPISTAKIQVLGPGTLYLNDAVAFGELDGSLWYSVTRSPISVKKIILKATPESDNPYSPAVSISGDDNAMFFIRGVDLKEGSIQDAYSSLSIKENKAEATNGRCSAYYKPIEAKSEPSPKDRVPKKETHELFINCDDTAYSVFKFILHPRVLRPSISWAGDLNRDGLPELLINYDPWEKNAPQSIYFSDKNNTEGKYIFAGYLQYQGC